MPELSAYFPFLCLQNVSYFPINYFQAKQSQVYIVYTYWDYIFKDKKKPFTEEVVIRSCWNYTHNIIKTYKVLERNSNS